MESEYKDKDWSDWTSLELSEDLVIMYQKKADSLPLTSFDVSLRRPCFNPGEQANSLALPVELNSKATC